MKILKVGPAVGSKNEVKVFVSVEDDNANRYLIKLYKDWLESMNEEQVKKAVRAIIERRHPLPQVAGKLRNVDI